MNVVGFLLGNSPASELDIFIYFVYII